MGWRIVEGASDDRRTGATVLRQVPGHTNRDSPCQMTKAPHGAFSFIAVGRWPVSVISDAFQMSHLSHCVNGSCLHFAEHSASLPNLLRRPEVHDDRGVFPHPCAEDFEL